MVLLPLTNSALAQPVNPQEITLAPGQDFFSTPLMNSFISVTAVSSLATASIATGWLDSKDWPSEGWKIAKAGAAVSPPAGAAVTTTCALAETEPSTPIQVSVKVKVLAVTATGEIICEPPLGFLGPGQLPAPPLPWQDKELLTVQAKVVELALPATTVLGEAVSVAVGGVGS